MLIKTDELYEGDDREWHMAFVDADDECFLCGEQIVSEMVFWRGATKHITLHPACAMQLGIKLIVDARQAGKFNITKREGT